MVKQVVANLLEASWQNKSVGIPMDHYAYGQRTWLGFCKAPYKAMMYAVKNMEALEYVTKQVGHLGRLSTFTPTVRFKELIPACKPEPLTFNHSTHPLVYLTAKVPVLDAEGKPVKDAKGKAKVKREFIELSDKQQEQAGRELLEKYNELLRNTTITYISSTTNSNTNITTYTTPLPYSTTGQASEVVAEVGGILVRIFQRGDETCQYGGRLYGKGFENHQSLTKAERSTIQVGGSATQELDWKAMHPFMAYALCGDDGIQYPLDDDPYLLDEEQPELRPLTKTMLLTALNCPSRKSCLLAIHNESQKIRKGVINGTAKPDNLAWLKLYDRYREDLKELYDELIDEHSPIADWIGTDKGILLQNLDSAIMLEVVRYFTDRGILVLPVHDSCIIAEKHACELKRVMDDTYSRHMNGHTCPIEIK